MNWIKRLAKKSTLIIIIYHILDNYLTGIRFKSGNFKTSVGATHSRFQNVRDSLKYINKVFEEYFTYSGLISSAKAETRRGGNQAPTVEDIRGKRVLELGPGDNFGVALKFLVSGASQVVCLDKFYSRRDILQQEKIYKAMRDELISEERQVFDEIVKFEDCFANARNDREEARNDREGGKSRPDWVKPTLRFVGDRIEYVYGHGIEEGLQIFPEGSFDMIVSRAVMEHLYDIDGAFRVMDRLLKNGGYMIHNIDFRDHGIFTSAGMHPLTFLTISDRVWRHMTYHSGKPNRMRIGYYRDKIVELGYEGKILVNRVIGSNSEINPPKEVLEYKRDYFDSTLSLIKEIRAQLQPGFSEMGDEELMVGSVFLIAKKREVRKC